MPPIWPRTILAAFRLPDLKRGAWRLASAVANLALILTTALAIVAIFVAPWLVAHLIAPGFDPAQQALTVRLMRLMLVTPVIFGVSGIVIWDDRLESLSYDVSHR